jgi:hypothetical protein
MKSSRIRFIFVLLSVLTLLQAQDKQTIYVTGSVSNIINLVNKEVIIQGKTELHVLTDYTPLTNSVIKLENEDAWVYFDNIRPQAVVDSVVPFVYVNGEKAVLKQNLRVAIYKHGAVIMPHGESYKPLTIYADKSFGGENQQYGLFTFHNDLQTFDNKTRSFKLKKGYMATLANNADGTGYSRVYIAENADLEVSAMPTYLDQTVSFIRVFNWEWVTKKGWDQSGWKSSGSERTNADKMNATWYYTWSADQYSTPNLEYVPIKQLQYWPGWTNITDVKNTAHLMSYNEPDHAEQSNVSVKTAVAEWPNHLKTGLRLGSPATTDFNWLYQFLDSCKARNYRVDYVVIHAYWGGLTATQWYNQLKAVHDKTGRGIWIKEWNNGANWTTETWPTAWDDQMTKQYNEMKAILNVMDTAHFVERYSVYNWVEAKRAMILDDGWLTPAGKYYADNKSKVAFNRANEIIPGYKFSSINNSALSLNPVVETGGINLSWTNAEQEFASKVAVDKKTNDGEFQEIYQSNQTAVPTYTDIHDFNTTGRIQYRSRIILNTGVNITSNTQTLDVTPGGDIQYGNLSYGNAGWNTIAFKNKYSTIPMIFFGAPTNNNLSVLLTQRTKVSSNKIFTFQLWPWAYQKVTTYDKEESVPYFALKPGTYNWGGLKASSYKTSATAAWRTISFPYPFDTIPVVLVTQATANNDFPTIIRVKNITKTGFDVKIQKESGNSTAIVSEIFSYLAVQQGVGNIDGKKIVVGRTLEGAVGNALTQYARITYGDTIQNPVFLAQLQTCNDDSVTATLRCRSITKTEARVFKQREVSMGYTASANETAGYMLINPDELPQAVNQLEMNAFELYPNPVSENLYLRNLPDDLKNIRIYNFAGVLLTEIKSSMNQIDVSALSPGVYYLKGNNGYISKFIKQ